MKMLRRRILLDIEHSDLIRISGFGFRHSNGGSMMFYRRYAIAIMVLLTASVWAAPPTTRPNAYPWDTAVCQEPPRMRKAWIPCYHIDPRRLDNTLRTHDKF